MSTLTESGWPRPRNAAGFPVPWISPADDLAEKESGRQRKVAKGRTCQVCGQKLRSTCIAFVSVDDPVDMIPPGTALADDDGIHAMDHGLLHERCARLALAWCPELNRLRAEHRLAACRVPPGSIEAFGTDVTIIPLDDLHP